MDVITFTSFPNTFINVCVVCGMSYTSVGLDNKFYTIAESIGIWKSFCTEGDGKATSQGKNSLLT